MKEYKVYVNGFYVGTESLTKEDIKRINKDSNIILK